MANNRTAIISLFLNNIRQCDIARQLKIPHQTVSKAIKRYQELGNDMDRSRSGRPRTKNTAKTRKCIHDRIKRNSRVSMKKIARETGINRESARLIAKNELGLRPYKLQKVQLLTDKMKATRLKRCRALMRRVQVRNGRRFFSQTRSCSLLKLRIIIKMIEFGQQILLDLLPLSGTRNIPNQSWYGVESAPRVKLR